MATASLRCNLEPVARRAASNTRVVPSSGGRMRDMRGSAVRAGARTVRAPRWSDGA